MDLASARLLVTSLLGRIQKSSGSSNWSLGAISGLEREALSLLAGADLPEVSENDKEVVPLAEPESGSPVVLDQRSLLAEVDNSGVILSLDFGTAVSKAFAMRPSGEPIEIALGVAAGSVGYLVESTIFITDDSKVLFGPEAIAASESASETGRIRFDSPKSRLNMGQQANIDTVPVPPEINPTGVPLSEGDLIVLYLAYLTDLAVSQLELSGVSRSVRRRFARPCWDSDRHAWAAPLMQKMLAKAQILADTFHGAWKDGISVRDAKTALGAVGSLTQLPLNLIFEGGVAEPVAAAASLMIEDVGQREVFMVVDVGAGTTDFGLFLLQHNPHRELLAVHPVPGTIQNFKQAGDVVDQLLMRYILEKAGIDGSDMKHGRHVSIALQGKIRQEKERLFRDKEISVSLANQASVNIALDEFLEDQRLRAFSAQMAFKFAEVLGAIEGLTGPSRDLILDVVKDRGLYVVLTGGGATLPMVASLSQGGIDCLGHRITLRGKAMVPAWIESAYPRFAPQYPQLAVAIGGAARDLPAMASALSLRNGGP